MYGIITLAIIVIVILLFTFLFSQDEENPKSGSDILQFTPLVDGYNALPAIMMNSLNGTIRNFPFEKNLSAENSYLWCQTDLPRLRNGMVNTQVWTVQVPCLSQYKDAVAKSLQQLDVMRRLISLYKDDMTFITKANDIINNFDNDPKKINSLLAIDGGHAIDNKLAVLRTYHSLGVRLMSLTSDCDTPWAASYNSNNERVPLTTFGKKIVKEMNRLGIIIDLGQMEKSAQLSVISESQAPVVISKVGVSDSAAVNGNIDDLVLRKLEVNDGVVLIPFDSNVLKEDDTKTVATLKDVVDHINHIRKIAGVDHVAIGAGFNSNHSKSIDDLKDSSAYPILFDRLIYPQKGEMEWTTDELKKLAGLNFIRVFEAVEKVSISKADENPKENLIDPKELHLEHQCYTGK